MTLIKKQKLISGHLNGKICFWNIKTGGLLSHHLANDSVAETKFDATNKFLFSKSRNGQISFFNLANEKEFKYMFFGIKNDLLNQFDVAINSKICYFISAKREISAIGYTTNKNMGKIVENWDVHSIQIVEQKHHLCVVTIQGLFRIWNYKNKSLIQVIFWIQSIFQCIPFSFLFAKLVVFWFASLADQFDCFLLIESFVQYVYNKRQIFIISHKKG